MRISKLFLTVLILISIAYPTKAGTADEWLSKSISEYFVGTVEKALSFLDSARKSNPDEFNKLYIKGLEIVIPKKLHKADEAIEYFDKALDINPEHYDLLIMKGHTLQIIGRSDEAIKCYEKAIEINPGNTDAWNRKGFVLLITGRYDDLITFSEKIIEANPESLRAWNHKGMAYMNKEEYGRALKCFMKTIEIDSNFDIGYYQIALVNHHLDNKKEMILYLRKAIELYSEFKEIIKKSNLFDGYRNDPDFIKLTK